MATFTDLTPQQQAIATDFVDTLLRPTVLHCAGSLRRVAAVLNDDAARGVGAILALLDAGVVIPTSTGLAGAQALSKDDVEAIVADFVSLNSTYNTPAENQRFARAAGTINVMQT